MGVGLAERQHDRGSSDEADARSLPRFVRYRDLFEAGLVASWTQLNTMIDELGFPPGILLSPNIRAWRLDDVLAWLDARPSERKEAPAALLRANKADNEQAA